MIYKSPMPRVVGEFDAANLNHRIEETTSEHPDLPYYDVEKLLNGGEYIHCMSLIAGVKWNRMFRLQAFENQYTDGQNDNIQRISSGTRDEVVDHWHADDSPGILSMPEILTTASRWPTEFLVGQILVKPSVMFGNRKFFWDTDAGIEAIDTAIQIGDAWPYKFLEGEVVQAPSGAIHRRSIPSDWCGYRYFMRRFPRFDLTRAKPYVTRIRIL